MSNNFLDTKGPVDSKAVGGLAIGEAEAQPRHGSIQVVTLHADGVDVVFEEQAALLNQAI